MYYMVDYKIRKILKSEISGFISPQIHEWYNVQDLTKKIFVNPYLEIHEHALLKNPKVSKLMETGTERNHSSLIGEPFFTKWKN